MPTLPKAQPTPPCHPSSRLLQYLLQTPVSSLPATATNTLSWKSIREKYCSQWEHPIDQAILGGFYSDRIAFAFLSGYQAAIQHLIPRVPITKISAFCISEKDGNHPRAIKTRLAQTDGQWFITGEKNYVACAKEADILILGTSLGTGENGTNQIKMVEVPANAPGVSIEPSATLPFIPEVSHGRACLSRVPVTTEAILSGDGYTDYVKPFRTIEEVHIAAALSGLVLRTGKQYGWPERVMEKILGTIFLGRSLSLLPPKEASTHITLAGARKQLDSLLCELEPYLRATPETHYARWQRDIPLMTMGGTVSRKRTEAAWKSFHS